MDRAELEQQLQLKVLKRFDVLIDCSDLSDAALRKLATRLPRASGDNLTFAGWCDQVFDAEPRPRVFTLRKNDVPGQTRLSSLTLGLATQLRRQDRSLNALQAKLDRAQAEQQAIPEPTALVLPVEQTEESWRWHDFYSNSREALRRLIGTVEGVQQAHIFDYHGASNRTYRIELLESVHETLKHLSAMGFGVVVTFPAQRVQKVQVSEQVFYRYSDETPSDPDYAFSVDEMPTDILHLPRDTPRYAPNEALPERATCQIELHVLDFAYAADDPAVQHLKHYLQKVFQALAKSADHVPRGVLREMLLLGFMLSITAPHLSLERTLQDLPWRLWRPRYDISCRSREAQLKDLDPGQIVDLFIARLCNMHH